MWPVTDCQFEPARQYDAAFVSVGFERRSSHLLRRGLTAGRLFADPFADLRTGEFAENLALARHAGAEIVEGPEIEFGNRVGSRLSEIAVLGGRPVRIAVDISSMTRVRLATMLLALRSFAQAGSQTEVDFFYSPAEYQEPSLLPSGRLAANPVTPEYRGRLRRSGLPIGAVIGLGYEPQRALGTFELLEPSRAWAFCPQSSDLRYSSALQSANAQLLRLLGPESVFDYEVTGGADVVYALESFVFAVAPEYRLVLIPMGPKIFALACLLVGLFDSPERPAVWRVGEVKYSQPVNAIEAGPIAGVRVVFDRGPAAA